MADLNSELSVTVMHCLNRGRTVRLFEGRNRDLHRDVMKAFEAGIVGIDNYNITIPVHCREGYWSTSEVRYELNLEVAHLNDIAVVYRER